MSTNTGRMSNNPRLSTSRTQGSRLGPSRTDWNQVSHLAGAAGTFAFMHRSARRERTPRQPALTRRQEMRKLPSGESSFASSGTVSDTPGWLSQRTRHMSAPVESEREERKYLIQSNLLVSLLLFSGWSQKKGPR